MAEHTRAEFAEAVSAAISSVLHLYRELDNLMRELREALSEPPDPLTAVSGMMGKGGRDGRQVIRHEYGVLFKALLDEEGLDEEEDDEGEDDEMAAKRMRGKVEIDSDEAMVGLRIALYDSRKKGAFEPHLVYGVMDAWAVGPTPPESVETFTLLRHMLRRIPRALAAPDLAPGSPLSTLAKVYSVGGAKRTRKGGEVHLSCRLPRGVEVVPLYLLDSPDAVGSLAQRIKAMWSESHARS